MAPSPLAAAEEAAPCERGSARTVTAHAWRVPIPARPASASTGPRGPGQSQGRTAACRETPLFENATFWERRVLPPQKFCRTTVCAWWSR